MSAPSASRPLSKLALTNSMIYSKPWRDKRRAAGGCIHCRRPATPSFSTCAFHREYYREAKREMREREMARE
jgi:radical SAM superfamily enzyme